MYFKNPNENLRLQWIKIACEAVDDTGHLGGYNFQWAWASAVAAAEWI